MSVSSADPLSDRLLKEVLGDGSVAEVFTSRRFSYVTNEAVLL